MSAPSSPKNFAGKAKQSFVVMNFLLVRLFNSLMGQLVSHTGSNPERCNLATSSGEPIRNANDLQRAMGDSSTIMLRADISGGTQPFALDPEMVCPVASMTRTPVSPKTAMVISKMENPVIQGDLVRRVVGADRKVGWVCCVSPEHNEAHVYWLDERDENGSRNRLTDLVTVDRPIIPSDIVRKSSGSNVGVSGIAIATRIKASLRPAEGPNQHVIPDIDVSRLPHIVPLRSNSLVVLDGWLGRVQSWQENLTVRFEDGTRCVLKAANGKNVIPAEGYVNRDFFPNMKVRLLRPEVDLATVQWMDGINRSIDPNQHRTAIIEDVQMGSVKVGWLTQVQSIAESPYNGGPPMDTVSYSQLRLLSCFSHTWWTIGDRTLFNKDVTSASHWKQTDWQVKQGKVNECLHEIVNLETSVDIRWQDGSVEEGVPSKDLSMCNPDQYAFFPLEIVTKKEDEEATYDFSTGYQNATSNDADRATMVATNTQRATTREGAYNHSDTEEKVGYVVRMDPRTRMVTVHWMDELDLDNNIANVADEEEEVTSFELQIDPDFGYRLGDAVTVLDPEDLPEHGKAQLGSIVPATEAYFTRIEIRHSASSMNDFDNIPSQVSQNNHDTFHNRMINRKSGFSPPYWRAAHTLQNHIDLVMQECRANIIGNSRIIGRDPVATIEICTRAQLAADFCLVANRLVLDPDHPLSIRKKHPTLFPEFPGYQKHIDPWRHCLKDMLIDLPNDILQAIALRDNRALVLATLKHIPLMKADFRDVARAAIDVMDKLCPTWPLSHNFNVQPAYIVLNQCDLPCQMILFIRVLLGMQPMGDVAQWRLPPLHPVALRPLWDKPFTDDEEVVVEYAEKHRRSISGRSPFKLPPLKQELIFQPHRGFVNIGQIVAMHGPSVSVLWLDGTVTQHAPQVLIRVADDDEGMSDGAGSEGEWMDFQAEALVQPTQERENTREPSATDPTPAREDTPAIAPPPPPPPLTEGRDDDDEEDVDEDKVDQMLEQMIQESVAADHQYLSSAQNSGGVTSFNRAWTKKINQEWQILAKSLPPEIRVHVFEDRLDLLRAVLCGPSGTPYADALFFFDVQLPPNYPNVPPNVKFWSFGESINPNLYDTGKVCLSLLGTWSGEANQMWQPDKSNILQVLLSILGLILVQQPYYNEPGFEREKATEEGETRSRQYNESARLLTLHSMLKVLRMPPSGFEEYARSHFRERRHRILDNCKRLLEDPTSQPAVERENSLDGVELNNNSEGFKKSLRKLIPKLEEAFGSLCDKDDK